MENSCLMKVESIAECSKGSILQILLTWIKRLLVLKINFEWPLKTGYNKVNTENKSTKIYHRDAT